MKISQLCKMIEDSIHAGKYQLDDQQKHFMDSVQVINILPVCLSSRSQTETQKEKEKYIIEHENCY